MLLAGLLHVAVPRALVSRHMGGRGWRAALKGAVVGVPLPLCSCGIIPFAESLKRQGASRGAITSFLIATPQTGVDSVLATGALLGWPIAAWRVLTALVSGVLGGTAVSWAVEDDACGDPGHEAPQVGPEPGLTSRLREALSYGFGMLLEDIAFWLSVGILVGGAIGAFVPPDFFSQHIANPYLQTVAVLAVAVPLYVCATGSIPIAAALVAKGLPLGAAVVFLIAGPATNVATLSVFAKALGRRTVAIYLGTIVLMSLAFGMAFQLLFPELGLAGGGQHHHHDGPLADVAWWEWASAALLGLLTAAALWRRALLRLSAERAEQPLEDEGDDMQTIELEVQGMNCGHCSGSVEQVLGQVPGVQQVQVSLEQGRATVRGEGLALEPLVEAVQSRGFEAREAS